MGQDMRSTKGLLHSSGEQASHVQPRGATLLGILVITRVTDMGGKANK